MRYVSVSKRRALDETSYVSLGSFSMQTTLPSELSTQTLTWSISFLVFPEPLFPIMSLIILKFLRVLF